MPDCTVQLSSNGFQPNDSVTDKEAEIETLNDLSGELEKKASIFLIELLVLIGIYFPVGLIV